MTTGIGTGPFQLSNATPLVIFDPQVSGVASDRVQLQNASGFLISVMSDGAAYTIQPYTASTIPTPPGGAAITVTPTAVVPNQIGSLSPVWLLPGQDAPMEDGNLTSSVSSQRTTTLVTSAGLSPASGSSITIAAGGDLGTSNYVQLQSTDQSLTFLAVPSAPISSQASALRIRAVGNLSGQIYFDSAIPYQDVVGDSDLNYAAVTFPISAGIDTAIIVNAPGYTVNDSTSSIKLSILAGSIPTGVPTTSKPIDIVIYGGRYQVNNGTSISGPGTVSLLGTPPTNCAWRLHSWTIRPLLAANVGPIVLVDTFATNHALGHMNNVAQQGRQSLDGQLLVTTGLSVSNLGTVALAANQVSVAYDLVALPYIA